MKSFTILLAVLLACPTPGVASGRPGQVVSATANPAGAVMAGATSSRDGALLPSDPGRPAPTGFLEAAVSREAARLAGQRAVRTVGGLTGLRQQSAQAHRSWIDRHPVWFGTILGAVAGTAVAAAAWGNEGAFVGFYGGAAVGAIIGALVAAH